MQHPNTNLWLATGGKLDLFISSENTTDQSAGTNSLEMCCLATGYKTSHFKIGKRLLYIFFSNLLQSLRNSFLEHLGHLSHLFLSVINLLVGLTLRCPTSGRCCHLPKWWAIFPTLPHQPTPPHVLLFLANCALQNAIHGCWCKGERMTFKSASP